MNSFNQSIRNLTIKIMVLGITMMVSLVIPGILGPHLFGLYTMIIVWIGFLIPLTSLGIGSGIVFFISNRSYTFQESFSSNLLIATIIGLMNVLLLTIFYCTGLLNFMDSSLQLFKFSILSFSIFIQSINFILGRSLLGNSDYEKLNKLELLNSTINPVLMLIAMSFLGIKDSLFIYIAYGIVCMVIFISSIFLIYNKIALLRPDKNYIKKTFSYGLKSWLGDIALRANLRIDQLILGSFVSLNALGIYSVAVKLAELIWLLPDSVGPILFNAIAKNTIQESKLLIITRVHRLILFLSLLLLLIWILICYLLIIPIWLGQSYKDCFLLLILLVPGSLFLISSKIVTKLFSASGEVIWTSKITIFGSAISVLFYLMLIPLLGCSGAAIAASIGYFSLAIAGIYVLKSNFPVQLKDLLILKRQDIKWLGIKITDWKNSFLNSNKTIA